MPKQSRFVILDICEEEQKIIFRDREHFKLAIGDLRKRRFQFFALDDQGKAHPLKK